MATRRVRAGWFHGQARHLVRKDPTVGAACHHVPVVRPLSILPDRAGEYSGGRLSAQVSAEAGHGMILIEWCVDIEDATCRVSGRADR